jgi:hypothetical protein
MIAAFVEMFYITSACLHSIDPAVVAHDAGWEADGEHPRVCLLAVVVRRMQSYFPLLTCNQRCCRQSLAKSETTGESDESHKSHACIGHPGHEWYATRMFCFESRKRIATTKEIPRALVAADGLCTRVPCDATTALVALQGATFRLTLPLATWREQEVMR